MASVEQRVAQPGDRICGTCGEPNDPSRKFCRRCGAGLGGAAIVAEKPVSWWRRLFARKPKTYAAGERDRRMAPNAKAGFRSMLRIKNMIGGALAVLTLAGVVGYVGVPSFQKYVNEAVGGGIPGIIESLRRIVAPSFTIERPVSFTASSETDGHEVRLLFDTFTNTHWEGTGATPSVQVEFKAAVDLGAVFVHAGAAVDFVDLRRPAVLEFRFPDGTSQRITLEDIHDPQQFTLDKAGVASVEIRVVDTNGPADAPVAISEIEFLKKD